MFVDTRLYISVRPTLEYELPSTSIVIRRYLLGDASLKEAYGALERCVAVSKEELNEDEEVVEVLRANEDVNDDVAELRRLCMRVCSDMHDYLYHMHTDWFTHLNHLSHVVRKVTRQLTTDVDDAQRIHALYHTQNPCLIDRELRNEVLRIERELTENIDTLHNIEPPTSSRPAPLLNSACELKDCFTKAYGRIPTRTLIALKHELEYNMAKVQRAIAKTYTHKMTELLTVNTKNLQ